MHHTCVFSHVGQRNTTPPAFANQPTEAPAKTLFGVASGWDHQVAHGRAVPTYHPPIALCPVLPRHRLAPLAVRAGAIRNRMHLVKPEFQPQLGAHLHPDVRHRLDQIKQGA